MAKHANAKGFTLIELVCVIAILGVLAATAMPKFANLAREARIAKLNAMAVALHATAQLWLSVCLVQSSSGACMTSDSGETLTNNGTKAEIYHGYPNAGDLGRVNQIDTLITADGFTATKPDVFYNQFSIADAPTPTSCAVTYCENNNISNSICYPNSYRVVIDTSGC